MRGRTFLLTQGNVLPFPQNSRPPTYKTPHIHGVPTPTDTPFDLPEPFPAQTPPNPSAAPQTHNVRLECALPRHTNGDLHGNGHTHPRHMKASKSDVLYAKNAVRYYKSAFPQPQNAVRCCKNAVRYCKSASKTHERKQK